MIGTVVLGWSVLRHLFPPRQQVQRASPRRQNLPQALTHRTDKLYQLRETGLGEIVPVEARRNCTSSFQVFSNQVYCTVLRARGRREATLGL